MAQILNITALTTRTQAIQENLAGGSNYKPTEAVREAKQLYKDGLTIIAKVVRGEEFDVVTPVVVTLSKILTDVSDNKIKEMIQHEYRLHRYLSKSYRVFVELMWYQCKALGMPTMEETREDITKSSSSARSFLGEKEIKSKFNYRCTKEAATLLKLPINVTIKKFAGHGSAIGAAIKDQSVVDFATAFMNFAEDVKKENAYSWYHETHYLHWTAISIKTKQELDKTKGFILNEDELQNKSGEYVLCLTTIFMDFIKDPKVEEAVKDVAFTNIGLFSQIEDKKIQDVYRSKMLVKFLENAPNKIARGIKSGAKKIIGHKVDSFAKVRKLAIGYLCKLSTSEKYASYSEKSLSLLDKLPERKYYEQVSDQAKLKANELKSEKQKCEKDKMQVASAFKKASEEGTRGSGDDSLDKIKNEFLLLKEKDEQLKTEIEQYESFQALLEEINREEKEYLRELRNGSDKN